jgi:2-polyprenyl-3-methyl-5-hydroxy-6-metoxy-1,4-benzoquinol methylase
VKSEDWNRKYAEKELVWSAAPNRFLVAEVAGLEPGRALDVACGEGRNAIWLAEQGWRVTGVDFSDVAVEKGRRIAERRGVEVDWRVEDVLAYEPEPAAYDLVILFYLQLVQDELRRVLERAAGAVAPGGTFLLVAHDTRNLTDGWGGPQDAAVLYRPEDVVPALDGLEVEKADAVLRPVEEESATAVDCLVRARRPA